MNMDNGLFYRFLLWRDRHIPEKHFILIVSFLVGLCTAAAAIILKWLIHTIQHWLTGNFNLEEANYLYLLYPVIGILLAGLFVKYIVRDDISHGVTKILYAISQRKSRIKPHNTWSSIVASSVTIGFGGSVGAEAPIVLTGAAIGSNLGRLFRLEQRTLMLLVGCGAAGAIAGIFKAPIAGMVFVVEVLLLDLTMTSVLPLLITSVTAATVSYIFTGTEAMFQFSQTEPFMMERIPYVLLLGVFCGLVSLYFTKVMNRVEGMYRRLGKYWKKFVVGGVTLSVLIFLFPPMYGEGYDTISELLNGNGFMAVYVTGMVMGNGKFIYHNGLGRFHDGMAWLMQVVLFTMLGLLATPSLVWESRYIGLAIAAFLMIAARPLAVFLCMLGSKFSWNERLLVSWVGLRGGAPVMLATFPWVEGLPNHMMMFHIVFFIVLTSVILQGMTIMPAACKLNLNLPLQIHPRVPLEFENTGNMNGDMKEYEIMPGSPFVGKTLANLGLPVGALVLLIRRGGSYVVPHGNTELQLNDSLMVLGTPEVLEETGKFLGVPTEE